MNNDTAQLLSTTILQQFPTTPQGFVTSLASKLLKRFPLFFLFLPLPSDGPSEIPDTPKIRTLRQDTEAACSTLDALSRIHFDDVLDEVRTEDDLNENPEIFFSVKKKGQSKKKQNKRGRRISPADYKAIESSGFDLPRTSAEVRQISAILLESQMETLKVCALIVNLHEINACSPGVPEVVPFPNYRPSNQTCIPPNTRYYRSRIEDDE